MLRGYSEQKSYRTVPGTAAHKAVPWRTSPGRIRVCAAGP